MASSLGSVSLITELRAQVQQPVFNILFTGPVRAVVVPELNNPFTDPKRAVVVLETGVDIHWHHTAKLMTPLAPVQASLHGHA